MENSGSTDTTLCHGVPTYQKGGDEGPVLFRRQTADGRTTWFVSDSSVLDTCYAPYYRSVLESAFSDQPGPPTAPGYNMGRNYRHGTGWNDYHYWRNHSLSDWCESDCGITVIAGGH